ncbi:hypothetical protein J7M23_09565 [Candidatus Sumerlaeota bacterium]|nr:hypothetical protein [Candidatus Sumerlaeota bacterium]
MLLKDHKTFQSAEPYPEYPWIWIPSLNPNGYIDVAYHNRCENCLKKTTCKALGEIRILSNDGNNPIPDQYRFSAKDIRMLQRALSFKHWVACGLDGFNFLYSTQDLDNYVKLLGSWEILEVIGATTLKLKYEEGVDTNPKEVCVYSYSYWDLEVTPPVRRWVHVTGSIAPTDKVKFSDDSIIADKIECEVADMDLSTLENGYFTITVDQAVTQAMYAKDPHKRDPDDPEYEEPEFKVSLFRYSRPEQWIEPRDNEWLYCVPHFIIAPVDSLDEYGRIELKNKKGEDCRIALPKAGSSEEINGKTVKKGATICIQKLTNEGWIDITEQVISQKRIWIEQTVSPISWKTTLWLRGYLPPDFSPSEDLLSDASLVRVDYLPEATDIDKQKEAVCIGKCANCVPDYNGVCGIGEQYNGKKYWCKKYQTASGFSKFVPGRCYQPSECDGFEEEKPFQLSAKLIDQARIGANTYIQQMFPGVSHHRNFYLGRADDGVPSIGYQLGLNRLSSAVQMFGKRSWVYGQGTSPQYGLFNDGTNEFYQGAFIDDRTFQNIEQVIIDDTGGYAGVLAQTVYGWDIRRTKYDQLANDVSDPYRLIRNYFSRVQRGVLRDDGSLSGVGEAYVQRFISKTFWLPKIEKDKNYSQIDCGIEFGYWVIGGNTYRIKITLKALAGYSNDWGESQGAKASGYVASLSEEEPDVFKVECRLGTHRAARTVPGMPSYDETVEFAGGGNIVEPPLWKKINSYYEIDRYKTIHCREHFACEGDVIEFNVPDGHPLYQKRFWIRETKAHSGTNEYTSGLPSVQKLAFYTIEGFYVISVEDGDKLTDISVRRVDGENEIEMTRYDIRPGHLAYDEYWCENLGTPENPEYRNIICFSQENVDDVIRIYYKLNNSPNWEDYIEINGSTIPSGTIIWYTTDEDFQANPDTIEVYDLDGNAFTRITNPDDFAKDTFYVFQDSDNYWKIIFHYDNSGEMVEIKWQSDSQNYPWQDLVGLPPYYASDVMVGGVPQPSHPMSRWGGKRDVLYVEDENDLLKNHGSGLVDVEFRVYATGVIHPGHSLEVMVADAGAGEWIDIPSEHLHIERAKGEIYISEDWYNEW